MGHREDPAATVPVRFVEHDQLLRGQTPDPTLLPQRPLHGLVETLPLADEGPGEAPSSVLRLRRPSMEQDRQSAGARALADHGEDGHVDGHRRPGEALQVRHAASLAPLSHRIRTKSMTDQMTTNPMTKLPTMHLGAPTVVGPLTHFPRSLGEWVCSRRSVQTAPSGQGQHPCPSQLELNWVVSGPQL